MAPLVGRSGASVSDEVVNHAENNDVNVPPEARCLTCGYLLRGLTKPLCPECGREFDPQDLATFDHDPRRRRRRRWLIRLCVWGTVGVVLLVLAPRGLLRSKMVLTDSSSGQVVTVTRWEAVPPRWIPLRYAGVHWTSRTGSVPPGDTTTAPCATGAYSVNVRVEMRCGWCSGTGNAAAGETVYINGRQANPDTAAEILRRMMSPANTGITIWTE